MDIHWKDWCWSWNSNTLATWYEKLTTWKRPWLWERLKAGGEGDDRGWDGWMASLTQWTWIWASSGSWWWTGKTGVLQFMGSQRVRHDWVTELTWIDEFINKWKHESFLLLKVYYIHLGIEKVVLKSLMGLSLFYNSVRYFSLYLPLFTNWCERINTLAFYDLELLRALEVLLFTKNESAKPEFREESRQSRMILTLRKC